MPRLVSLLLLVALATPAVRAQERDAPSLTEELLAGGDDANVDRIEALAALRTREALDGLAEVYGAMQSVYMRRAVLRGLADFDDEPTLALDALQLIADVATGAKDRSLRRIAIDLLEGCEHRGKEYLRIIVDSPADDEVRELALSAHTGQPREADRSWYRELFERRLEPGAKLNRREREELVARGLPLPSLREIAFEAIVTDLPIGDVVDATSDQNGAIRVRALEELESRGENEAAKVAREIYGDNQARAEERLLAAEVLRRTSGPSIAKQFIADATKNNASETFALGLAKIVSEIDDPSVERLILRQVGRGSGLRLLFSLRAAANVENPALEKTLVKLLEHEDPAAVREAMRMLADRRVAEALDELEAIVEESNDSTEVAAALDAIGTIRGMDDEWLERLARYTDHESAEIRNGAIAALGATASARWLPVMLTALEHPEWTTRLSAARALEALRVKEGVGALVGRMSEERGRMSIELAEILFRLTGQPFGTRAAAWVDWWTNEKDGFELISADELRALRARQEQRRLKQITTSDFFGMKILSHRVVFVIDVSGSMAEPTRGEIPGEDGVPRIDLARRELRRCLESLDDRCFFNIIPFSSNAFAWRDEITQITAETRADAAEFIDKLGARGGTNLYGAVKLALSGSKVDTVYVLSDGEPSAGEIIDPTAIRRALAEWNESRGVIFNCIAVGGKLDVLEWIAKDSGGDYVRFP